MTPIRKKLSPNDLLFKAGDIPTSFFVILNGVISLFHERDGRNIEESRLTNNAIVGELTYHDPSPRSISARAVTDCELVEFPFDQIVADMKGLPGWTQLMVKTLSERLTSAHKELRLHRDSHTETNAKLTVDDTMKSCAALRLSLMSLDSIAEGTWEWEKVREFSMQTFQIPALKMEPIARAFAENGWLKIETAQSEIVRLQSPSLERMKNFEAFIRRYRHSRGKRAVIEVTHSDFVAISALCAVGEGKANAKGTVQIQLPEALKAAKSMPGGSTFRADQFDLLLKKGLDISKESSDNAIHVSFNLDELEQIRSYWKVLLDLIGESA